MLAFIVETTKPPAYPFIIKTVKERSQDTNIRKSSNRFEHPEAQSTTDPQPSGTSAPPLLR